MDLGPFLASITLTAGRLLAARQSLQEASDQPPLPRALIAFLARQVTAREEALRDAQTRAKQAGVTEKAIAIATLKAMWDREQRAGG